jgi:carbonic anhydrase
MTRSRCSARCSSTWSTTASTRRRCSSAALTGAGPGELFLVRNVGAFVPPYDQSQGFHGTAAAIEFAVLNLQVKRIVVCGHSHCGAIRALYGEVPAAAQNLLRWLDLGREAALPVAEPGPEVLRRTEQRAIVLQLERLMAYPMVRERVDAGALTLHGWHYVIEDGEIHVFDVGVGQFVPASQADNAGTGPYQRFTEADALDYSGVPMVDGDG